MLVSAGASPHTDDVPQSCRLSGHRSGRYPNTGIGSCSIGKSEGHVAIHARGDPPDVATGCSHTFRMITDPGRMLARQMCPLIRTRTLQRTSRKLFVRQEYGLRVPRRLTDQHWRWSQFWLQFAGVCPGPPTATEAGFRRVRTQADALGLSPADS